MKTSVYKYTTPHRTNSRFCSTW